MAKNRGAGAKLRSTHVVKTVIRRFTEQWLSTPEQERPPCWICRQPIDATITDPDHDGHFEADHVYPVADYPEHAADPANLRPSHRGCNRKRSNSMVGSGLGRQSRDWESLGS